MRFVYLLLVLGLINSKILQIDSNPEISLIYTYIKGSCGFSQITKKRSVEMLKKHFEGKDINVKQIISIGLSSNDGDDIDEKLNQNNLAFANFSLDPNYKINESEFNILAEIKGKVYLLLTSDKDCKLFNNYTILGEADTNFGKDIAFYNLKSIFKSLNN